VKLSTNTRPRMVATAGGWDEVCDNQRWAIDHLLGGKLEHLIGLDQPEKLTLSFRKYCISLRRQVKQKKENKKNLIILTIEQVDWPIQTT
jgi:hypothetical protein